ncbi:hypothetical protein D3C72_1849600 [compost metagenome]
MVTRACLASPGCASCTTAPTWLAEGSATPKRSMWMRSSGTPAASSAASASSFIWNGPHTYTWSICAAGTTEARNSPIFSRFITPKPSGESVCSSENTCCSTSRVM